MFTRISILFATTVAHKGVARLGPGFLKMAVRLFFFTRFTTNIP